jgi:hypothetical protein
VTLGGRRLIASRVTGRTGCGALTLQQAADAAEIEKDRQPQVLAYTIPIYSHLRSTGNLADWPDKLQDSNGLRPADANRRTQSWQIPIIFPFTREIFYSDQFAGYGVVSPN